MSVVQIYIELIAYSNTTNINCPVVIVLSLELLVLIDVLIDVCLPRFFFANLLCLVWCYLLLPGLLYVLQVTHFPLSAALCLWLLGNVTIKCMA